jgi:hypothetical protein
VEGVGDPEPDGRGELQAQRQCGTRLGQNPVEKGARKRRWWRLRTSRSPPWPPLSDERSVVQVDRLRECAHQDALDETFQYFLGVTDMTSSLYRHNFVSFY